MPPNTLTIPYATLVHADAPACYDAFATAKGLDAWFTKGAVVDPRPAGRILFRWTNWGVDRVTAESGGPVLEALRPHRFIFQWNPVPEQPDHLTTVKLTFHPDPRGTIVRDGFFPDTDAGRRALCDCSAGWGEALTLMKFYVEHGLRY